MDKNILFILAASVVVFGTIALMAGATKSAYSTDSIPTAAASPGPEAASGSPDRGARLTGADPAGSCGGSGGGCGCGGGNVIRKPVAPAAPPGAPVAVRNGVQPVTVRAEPDGYDKEQVTVKAGTPVEFRFSASPNAGCGRQLILDGFDVNLISRNGEEQVATFTPTAAGRYSYHCGMNMFRGVLNVV